MNDGRKNKKNIVESTVIARVNHAKRQNGVWSIQRLSGDWKSYSEQRMKSIVCHLITNGICRIAAAAQTIALTPNVSYRWQILNNISMAHKSDAPSRDDRQI